MDNNRINVSCSICNESFDVTKKSYVRKQKSGAVWKCKKCLAKESKERYQLLSEEEKERRAKVSSERLKVYWKNIDPTKKSAILDKLNSGYQEYNKSLTDAEKEVIINEKREFMKHFWENVDDDSKNKLISSMHEGFHKWYNSLSEEEKKIHHQYIQNGNAVWWNGLQEEERKKYSEIRSLASRAYWDSLTDEDKKLVSSRQSSIVKEFWDNITPEKYTEWAYKRATAFNKYLDNLDDTLNKNELSLIHKLKTNGLVVESHYYNKTKHPDFDNLFSVNPVTGSKFISPYHQWDCKVVISECIVLVDIDGSIHDPNRVTHEITYFNGNKIKLSELISFNDSQRPYQTDGLPAYIIQCYDDNLNDNTPVINAINDEKITFKSFMALLLFMNMSKKDKREMIALL